MRKFAPRLLALLILPGFILTGCGGGGGGGGDAADTTPDPFAFIDQTNVSASTVITSNAVTITGIAAPASINVTGGTYSVGCGATFTAAAGTISNNQTVCVRQTSAAAPGAVTSTVLTVSGVADTFSSTTAGTPDTTPDPFVFVDQTNVALSATITSNAVTITGIVAPATISVANGTYSIGCGATFISAPGTISNNQTVCVRQTSAAAFSAVTNTTLTVGGVADTFTSTTAGTPDTTPNAFSFVDQTNVAISTVITSAPVTITGIDAPASISVANGTYSIGCGPTFTAAVGTISNSQTVCVRQTSAATASTATNTTLTVGGVADTFTSTTAATVNAAPVANAGPTQSVATGVLVALNGSGSSDANNDPLTYAWSLTVTPAGSTATLSSLTAIGPTFTPNVPGTYTARLVVNDGTANSAASTVNITVTTPITPPLVWGQGNWNQTNWQ